MLFSSVEETSNLKDLTDRIVDLLNACLLNIGLLLDLQRDGAIPQNSYPDVLPSTGGRPAYNITKEQVEQLRETGMNWRGVAKVLRISVSTFYRKRIELHVADTFYQIENEELDDQIRDVLRLTPYSGETYSMLGELCKDEVFWYKELELGKL